MVAHGGACMVARVWLLVGGACVVAHGGVCMVAPGGACVVAPGGHVWLLGGSVHGCSQGAWVVAPGGACMVTLGGACVVFSMRYGQ